MLNVHSVHTYSLGEISMKIVLVFIVFNIIY